VDGGRSAGSS